jgi:TolB protein
VKFLRLLIGLSLLSTTLVAAAIAYGATFPSREIVFDRQRAGDFTAYRMDIRTHVMRVLPVQSSIPNQEQWSPDGAQLAFLVKGVTGDSVYITGAQGETPRRVVDGGVVGRIASFSWSPDGRQLAVASDMMWIVDVAGDRPPSSFMPVTHGFSYNMIAWSPDGTQLAYNHFRSSLQLYTYEIATGNTRALTFCDDPDWSPDGSHIACVRDFHVVVVDVDSGEWTDIGSGFEPSWSPDGEWIAFSRGLSRLVDLMLYDMESGDVTTLFSNGTVNLMSDWRPPTEVAGQYQVGG